MSSELDYMAVECLNIPKALFFDEKYETLSATAKLLYSLLLDRMEMAEPSGWVDKYGFPYVVYPKEEMRKHLNVTGQQVRLALEELEYTDEMINVVRVYPEKECRIYVKDITDSRQTVKSQTPSPHNIVTDIYFQDDRDMVIQFTPEGWAALMTIMNRKISKLKEQEEQEQ